MEHGVALGPWDLGTLGPWDLGALAARDLELPWPRHCGAPGSSVTTIDHLDISNM